MSSEKDLMIEVRAVGPKEFRVKALASRLNFPEHVVRGYDESYTQSLLSELNQLRRASLNPNDSLDFRQDARRQLKQRQQQIGSDFFRLLFEGDLEVLLCKSIEAHDAGRTENRFLPIRLVFDPHDRHLTPMACLPWELIYREADGKRLGLNRTTPLARFFALDRLAPVQPFQVDGSLRVLVVASLPSDERLGKLDLTMECKRIAEALEGVDGVEVEFYEQPSVGGLHQLLVHEEFHVLHFMGHGGFHRGEGSLAFVTAEGEEAFVPAAMLATAIIGNPQLRLVVLNSCWSGALNRQGAQDPFLALAPALLRAGVPAVVAMQFPISDPGAIHFSSAFYRSLVEGDPVDVAATAGRLELYGEPKTHCEWMTPTVFLRVRDGRIFRRRSHSRAGRTDSMCLQMRMKFEDGQGTAWETPMPPVRVWIRDGRMLEISPDPVPRVLPADAETSGSPSLRIRNGTGSPRGRDKVLALSQYFNNHRILDGSLWREAIFPTLKAFLDGQTADMCSFQLDLTAHHTIAFATGWVLETKSSLDLMLREELPDGAIKWWSQDPVGHVDQSWRFEKETGRLESPDLALTLGSGETFEARVMRCLQKPDREVTRILAVKPKNPSKPLAIHSGTHALRLAQLVAQTVCREQTKSPSGTVHIFFAVPKVVAFFLGQLAPNFGRVQLYEEDVTEGLQPSYKPSLALISDQLP